MHERPPLTIDMTPQGTFRAPPARAGWPLRVGLVALGVSLVTGLVAVAALALYVAALLVPVALMAAAVAYLAWRISVWRARPAAGGPLTRQ